MVNRVNFPFGIKGLSDVMPKEYETFVCEQMLDVPHVPCQHVVNAQHPVAAFEKPFAKMRSYETRPSQDD